MNELTLWGKTLSISIKTQKKYHSLRVRIELNSFKAAAFDRKDWTTNLGGIPVRWFLPPGCSRKEKNGTFSGCNHGYFGLHDPQNLMAGPKAYPILGPDDRSSIQNC
jgi:hypothetical protein